MRIALNLGTLRGLGSGLVGRNLLRELAASRGASDLRAWVPREWPADGIRDLGISSEPVGHGMGGKLYAENISLRGALRSWPADRLFSLGDTSLVACPIPHLLLVQMPYLAYGPDERDFPIPFRFRVKLNFIEAYFRAGLSSVTAITVQSNHMASRMARRWNISRERIFVIPSAIEDTGCLPDRSHENYVIYPANPSAHKNHMVLASTMAELRRRGMRLTCKLTINRGQVPAMEQAAERIGVLDAFEFLGNIPLAECQRLMARAAAVLIPAKLETFGLVYYEAMQLGCAIVAADRECAREACGDAALYADADNGEAFADAVEHIVSASGFALELREKARARHASSRIGWNEIARNYLRLLDQM